MGKLLEHRAAHLKERMDDPDCDPEKLYRTYQQFAELNRLIARWRTLYRALIAPLAGRGSRIIHILDIGCGGGDLCLKLSDWANEDGIRFQITGIDPDPRAIEYALDRSTPSNVEFRQLSASNLIDYGEQYDVVLSNHLLHHLQDDEVVRLCNVADRLARKLVLFNDLRRSKTALTAFATTAPFRYRRSFIVRDGVTSIRRSFRRRELQKLVPPGWKIKKLIPFRLLAIHEIR